MTTRKQPAAKPETKKATAASPAKAPGTKPAAAKSKAKAPSAPSTVESPVKVVWAITERMTKANPGVARKDILAACLAKGVNRFTASTQIQRFKAAQKKAK